MVTSVNQPGAQVTEQDVDNAAQAMGVSQPSTVLQTHLFTDENGELKRLSSDELSKLDIDSQIVYVFLLASKLDDENIKKLLEKNYFEDGSIADYNERMQYTNEIFNDAAGARTQASENDKAPAPRSVLEFANSNGIDIDPNKKYSPEQWDVFLQQIEGVQSRLVQESELVTYDLERLMSDAATNMQLATKALSSIQSIRERQAQALSFR